MLSTWNIFLKPLTLQEARAVYLGHAHNDFPQDELKSFSMIEKLWNEGCYQGYGFYEMQKGAEADGKLRAYAFTMADKDANVLLVDYFAVCSDVRGQGFGGEAISLLQQNCTGWDGILFEVEDDESTEDAREKEIRQRRISFYERNGVCMTDGRSSAFGVDYKLMVLPLVKESAIAEKLKTETGKRIASVYQKMLPKQVYETMFRLR